MSLCATPTGLDTDLPEGELEFVVEDEYFRVYSILGLRLGLGRGKGGEVRRVCLFQRGAGDVHLCGGLPEG